MPTVILEAVASYDLWIWHALLGLPGALNDIKQSTDVKRQKPTPVSCTTVVDLKRLESNKYFYFQNTINDLMYLDGLRDSVGVVIYTKARKTVVTDYESNYFKTYVLVYLEQTLKYSCRAYL